MKLFKRDPAEILRKVQGELAAVEARKAELESKRAAALVEVDADVAEIAAIEDQIELQRRAVAVHHARVAALQGELRAQRREESAQEYTAAISVVKPRLAEFVVLSKRMDVAMSDFAACYFSLAQKRDHLFRNWPAVLPHPSFEAFKFDIQRQFGWLQHCLKHPPLDSESGGFEPSIAAGPETEVNGIIGELESAFIPDDDEDQLQEQAA